MTAPEKSPEILAELALPYGKTLTIQPIQLEDADFPLLRLRIREGKHRFTLVDLDVETARRLGDTLKQWIDASGS